MTWLRGSTPQAQPPGKPPLTRDQIVAAAVELADEDGLDALSIRRIAARIGAGATSLYWHVRSKDDLVALMHDAVNAEMELPEPTGDWRADLRTIALRTHDMYVRHPWLILLGIEPVMGPAVQRYGELTFRILDPVGLDQEDRIDVLAIMNNYVFGFVHRMVAWDRLRERSGLTDRQWNDRLERFIAQVSETDPALAIDLEKRRSLTTLRSFEVGLDCVLDGVAAHFRLPSPNSPASAS